MKNLVKMGFVSILFFSVTMLLSCAKNDNVEDPDGDECYVQLFDGDNYTDDNIIVKGPGEFADLSKLPGAYKNWDDEADSFKSGKNTTVTFYSEPNFEGESVTYKNGAQEPSIDEPRSMKIVCNK